MEDPRLRPLPEGVVTFLFTDVVGSTALLHAVGLDAYHVLLEEHRALVRECVGAFGGAEVSTEGDAILSAFGEAEGAVSAAEALQHAHREHAWSGPAVRVRAGLHAGDAKLDGTRDYVSLALHQAARIVSAANAGQVLASTEVAPHARPVGAFWLKDFPSPVTLHEVCSADDGSPPRAPRADVELTKPSGAFVGRDREVAELTTRTGTVVLVGPAGVGKSRLAQEVAWQLSLQGRPVVRELDSSTPPNAIVLRDEEPLPEANEHDVLVLATRRVPPPGTAVFEVAPLSTRDGAQLLGELARHAGAPPWAAEELARLASAVDGMPLALEVLAPRLVGRSPGEILQELHLEPDREPLSTVVAYALGACSPEERELLRALQPFKAPAATSWVTAVTGQPGVQDALDVLVARGVVQRQSDSTGYRYQLPQAVRRRLADVPESTRWAHARWVLAEVEHAWTPAYTFHLGPVADEVEAALDAGLPLDEQLRLLAALRGHLSVHLPRQAMGWAERVLDAVGPDDPRRPVPLDVLAAAANRSGSAQALQYAEQLVVEAARFGDPTMEMRGLLMADRPGLGMSERRRRAERARELLPRLELHPARADRAAHLLCGNLAVVERRLDDAAESYRALYDVATALHDTFNMGIARAALCEVAEEQGDPERALDEAKRAVHAFTMGGLHELAARQGLHAVTLQRRLGLDATETLAEVELAAHRAGSEAVLAQVAALQRH